MLEDSERGGRESRTRLITHARTVSITDRHAYAARDRRQLKLFEPCSFAASPSFDGPHEVGARQKERKISRERIGTLGNRDEHGEA